MQHTSSLLQSADMCPSFACAAVITRFVLLLTMVLYNPCGLGRQHCAEWSSDVFGACAAGVILACSLLCKASLITTGGCLRQTCQLDPSFSYTKSIRVQCAGRNSIRQFALSPALPRLSEYTTPSDLNHRCNKHVARTCQINTATHSQHQSKRGGARLGAGRFQELKTVCTARPVNTESTQSAVGQSRSYAARPQVPS